MTLSKLFNSSVPQSHHLLNGDSHRSTQMLLRRINKTMYGNHLVQCLAQSKCDKQYSVS